MKIFFLHGLKSKVNLLLRLIIIIALLIFFVSKIVEVLSGGLPSWFKEEKPSGNPLRVEIKEGFNYDVVEYEK